MMEAADSCRRSFTDSLVEMRDEAYYRTVKVHNLVHVQYKFFALLLDQDGEGTLGLAQRIL